MSTSTFRQKIRLPLVLSASFLLGLPLGRVLFPENSSPAPTAATNREADTRVANEPVGASTNADDSLDNEISKLLGGNSNSPANRTPAELIAEISAALSIKSELQRFSAIYEAVNRLGRDDLAEALRKAVADNNAIAIRAIQRRWAEVDPVGAAKLAQQEGQNLDLGDAFYAAWAKLNPSAALNFVSALAGDEKRNGPRQIVFNAIAKSDPRKAIDLSTSLPESNEKNRMLATAIETIAQTNSSEAMQLAKTLPEGDSRRAAIDAVITKVASTNISEAQAMLANLPPNTARESAAAIANLLFKDSRDSATQWANALPEGETKASAFSSIASNLAGSDVESAASWIESLPKGPSRDSAVAAFAGRTAFRDPEGATEWASTIPPGELRNNVLQRTLSIWQRTNSQAASQWIDKSPALSDAERTDLSKASQTPPEPRRFRRSFQPASPGQ